MNLDNPVLCNTVCKESSFSPTTRLAFLMILLILLTLRLLPQVTTANIMALATTDS